MDRNMAALSRLFHLKFFALFEVFVCVFGFLGVVCVCVCLVCFGFASVSLVCLGVVCVCVCFV